MHSLMKLFICCRSNITASYPLIFHRYGRKFNNLLLNDQRHHAHSNIPLSNRNRPRLIMLHHLFATVLLALTLAPVAHAEPLPRPDHAERLPHPDHVVIVIEENHGYAQIMDKLNSASYIHALANRGMLF